MTKPTNKPKTTMDRAIEEVRRVRLINSIKEPEWIENLENLDSPSVEELKDFINSLLKEVISEIPDSKCIPTELTETFTGKSFTIMKCENCEKVFNEINSKCSFKQKLKSKWTY